MYQLRPLANGTRTDHPVPDLPFVDDSHLPLDEGPEAVEAVGRNVADGMWGRYDEIREDGSWLAFTTDPIRHDLGWVVRQHPEHGRTVLLMRDGDISSMHTEWWGPQLLFRAGGYWWDGTTWYRPGQVWHPVHQRYERRKVVAAVTLSAADLLDGGATPGNAYTAKVAGFAPDAPLTGSWRDHLALWAQAHQQHPAARDLSACVVNLACPELAADQLLGAPEMADLGGITASTLRAYVARGESGVPLPQATVSGRNLWSRPVAQDWAEARRRSAEGVTAVLTTGNRYDLSPGAAEIHERFSKNFFDELWERPDRRKQWVLRSRNETSVREVADDLAWNVATDLKRILPTDLLSATIRHAVLDEFTNGLRRHNPRGPLKDGKNASRFDLTLVAPVAKMLDWFIRHHPASAQHTLGEIQREAETRLGIPAGVSADALRGALSLDGKLEKTAREEYLDRVLATSETA
ncbi:hypothetical protein ABTY61_22545 [Kitasatospora sp. NPDC096128]|uniref:hypothetical protein n=1 Tax=Kitasatospora sp. NPDC096128 TaxID=3155547 RepID=UPI00332877E1